MVRTALIDELVPELVRRSVKIGIAYVTNKIMHPKLEEPSYLNEFAPINEIRIVQNHIRNAQMFLQSGDRASAEKEMQQAIGISTCERCKRAMEQIVNEDNAIAKLDALNELVPVYYKVKEEEVAGELKPLVTKTVKTKLETQAEEIIKESCTTCAATEVLKICDFKVECIKAVTRWVKEQKAAGVSISDDELIAQAKKFKD